jgi:cell division protein FtsI (penicillin-binding protein 3)/stage V sporulation protein D (sporulation-specific penicillin-binding protein)
MKNRQGNRRVRLLLLGFTIVFAGLLARAFWLQGVRASALSKLAASQHRQTVTIPASRGTIFDRMGVQLAIGEQATTVYADPAQITDPRRVAVAAANALGLNPNVLYPKLLNKKVGFVYIERQAPADKAARLEKQQIPGLGFYPEERRAYPQGPIASQVLGFAGVDNNGLAGLELQYDKSLSGRPGSQTIVRDPFGRTIDVVSSKPVREGRNVYLTLDHTIQANAEAVLRQTIATWHAKSGSAIVLDPSTGGILAMAVEPGYDANRYPSAGDELQRNRAVTDTYEPGSTFKLVTVAGVLSEHLVTPQTAFTLPYSIQVADRVIHDAEPRGTVRYTVAQILSHSSNVGAITLAKMLGPERLGSWIDRFGYGKTTGIDYPGESPGIVLPVPDWSGSTIGNVPIGQGIAVTAIQMATAYAAIANGGIWAQPHLLDHIGGGAHPRIHRRRIVTRSVAGEIRTMLEDVVADGTGTLAAVPGYLVAGKTGTAQIPDSHGYSTSKYVSSFVGFVPASKPRLVILVKIEQPQGAIWGGVVAAPAFAQIARFDLQYLEVPPDGGLRQVAASH